MQTPDAISVNGCDALTYLVEQTQFRPLKLEKRPSGPASVVVQADYYDMLKVMEHIYWDFIRRRQGAR